MTFDVLDDDDGVVHDEPGGERDAEERQRVDREAEQLDEPERTDERHRDRDRRNQRRPPVLQEQEHDEHDERDGLRERRHDLANRFGDDARCLERDVHLHARRKAPGQTIDFRAHVAKHLQRVRGRELQDADADGIARLVARRGAVALGAELGARDVLHAHERAVGRALQDDVVEFHRIGQPSGGADADLKGLSRARRLLSDGTRRHLDVLLAQRLHDFAGRDVAAGEAIGIEPQAHGVAADAEDDHVADAGHALELVDDEAIDVVADEERIVLAVLGICSGGEHEVRRHLRDRDADLLDLVRQPPFGLRDAVLDVDGGDVEISRDLERDGDRARAVVAARRGHVLHALDAVDRLLERNRHPGLDRLRVRAVVERNHLHLRRRQLGELRDWQRGNGDRAGKNQHERANAREDRTADEGIDEHGISDRPVSARRRPAFAFRRRRRGRPASDPRRRDSCRRRWDRL